MSKNYIIIVRKGGECVCSETFNGTEVQLDDRLNYLEWIYPQCGIEVEQQWNARGIVIEAVRALDNAKLMLMAKVSSFNTVNEIIEFMKREPGVNYDRFCRLVVDKLYRL